jgi:hypothetical protein
VTPVDKTLQLINPGAAVAMCVYMYGLTRRTLVAAAACPPPLNLGAVACKCRRLYTNQTPHFGEDWLCPVEADCTQQQAECTVWLKRTPSFSETRLQNVLR